MLEKKLGNQILLVSVISSKYKVMICWNKSNQVIIWVINGAINIPYFVTGKMMQEGLDHMLLDNHKGWIYT